MAEEFRDFATEGDPNEERGIDLLEGLRKCTLHTTNS